LVFGCSTGSVINAASKLVSDVSDMIELYMRNFDPDKGELTVPDIYSKVMSRDAVFEIVTFVEAQKLIL
jgi:hypothetical protein